MHHPGIKHRAAAADLDEGERAAMTPRIERARALFGGSRAIDHFRRWSTPEQFFERAKKGLYWNPDDL